MFLQGIMMKSLYSTLVSIHQYNFCIAGAAYEEGRFHGTFISHAMSFIDMPFLFMKTDTVSFKCLCCGLLILAHNKYPSHNFI